jgi:translation initiation factor IF-2
LPKKIRVYELAKELGLTNKEGLDLALSLGIGVKSHSSSIEDAQADRVRRKADAEGLRREVTPDEPPPAPTPAPESRPGRTISSSSSPVRSAEGEARPRLISSRPTGSPAAPSSAPGSSAPRPVARPVRSDAPTSAPIAPAAQAPTFAPAVAPPASAPASAPARPVSPTPPTPPAAPPRVAVQAPAAASASAAATAPAPATAPPAPAGGAAPSAPPTEPRSPRPPLSPSGRPVPPPPPPPPADRAEWSPHSTSARHGWPSPRAPGWTSRRCRWLSRPHRRAPRSRCRPPHRWSGRPGEQQFRQSSFGRWLQWPPERRGTGRFAAGRRSQRPAWSAPAPATGPSPPAQPRRARANPADQLPTFHGAGARR